MHNYIFRTYIDGGREYYEYTDAADREQTIKKDFPFPESLMSLLYMDIWELEPITKRMDKALLAFYQSGAKDDLQVVAAGLDELASRHVYFELLRLDWLEGDVWLLCSDGLTNEVEEAAIERVLKGAGEYGEKLSRIVRMALEHGGRDNITGVLVTTEED